MRKSTLPKLSSASFKARSKVSDLVTSQARATTFEPDSSQAFEVASRAFSLRSIKTRLTWSALANSSAVAFPKPEPTPVITATFPFRDSAINQCLPFLLILGCFFSRLGQQLAQFFIFDYITVLRSRILPLFHFCTELGQRRHDNLRQVQVHFEKTR